MYSPLSQLFGFKTSSGGRLLRSSSSLLVFALALFGPLPTARAVSPPPDGGYPNGNTAEGDNALFSLTTGFGNTANGANALFGNQTGDDNTATGINALFNNSSGNRNTATGAHALSSNTNGFDNTANGVAALISNTSGSQNTASGANALISNQSGVNNTASGFNALYNNKIGSQNTATGVNALQNNNANNNTASGFDALFFNSNGIGNTATGFQALFSNQNGLNNTANGRQALQNNTSGSFNIALGTVAGRNLTTGSNNIDIGNQGVPADARTIRIGEQGTHNRTFIAGISGVAVTGPAVHVNGSGQLGIVPSSERFKVAIKPMDKSSEAILNLKPVSFHYKQDLDPDKIPQFGLIAEQVERVNPDLVVRDADGKVMTVRYDAVSAMLLNEFLKEHRKVEQQQSTITELKSAMAEQKATNAQQQKQIEALTATVQKVSDQVTLSKPAPQLVANP
jgi:uncharacterized coiled-coil protein SlyX